MITLSLHSIFIVELLTNTTGNRVLAFSKDATVELACEMRQYIRPDNFLMWQGPGSQIITNGTSRHQLVFTDGSPNEAANGNANLVPSRISTLVISNPEPADTGTYTCTVVGTSQVVAIQLEVHASDTTVSGTTCKLSAQGSGESCSNPFVSPLVNIINAHTVGTDVKEENA